MKFKPVSSQSTGPQSVPQYGASSPISLVELTPEDDRQRAPLIISICGGPGSGKSRFCGTAKGKIGVLPTETKTLDSLEEAAREFGKIVVKPSINLIRSIEARKIQAWPKTCIVIGDAAHKDWTPGQIQDEMQRIKDTIQANGTYPTCCQRHYYGWHVLRFKTCGWLMADRDDIGTIVIDSFGSFVDDVSYANYGLTGVIDPKEFGFAPREDMNKEIREFLNSISHKNLILTHHIKQVWKNNQPTSKWKPESQFSGIGYFASIMLEFERTDAGVYTVKVRDCQAKPSLIGEEALLDDEAITFSNLAELVYPGTEGAWE